MKEAVVPTSFKEVEERNYAGRVFDITQKNVRQLQLDVEYLIELLENTKKKDKVAYIFSEINSK